MVLILFLDPEFVATHIIAAKALAKALEGKDLLVQRGTLDIIIGWFPLSDWYDNNPQLYPFSFKSFSILKEDDSETLMKATLSTLLRRDMSLNRRVYTWLLGNFFFYKYNLFLS
jgi:hypothetical protein